MEGKLIEIKDIEEGDEVIISGNSSLKYLKVIKKPVFKGNCAWGIDIDPITQKRTWVKNRPKYSSVRCSLRQDKLEFKSNSGNILFRKEYVFETDTSKHNLKLSIDLNNRDIYLVKRPEKQIDSIWQAQ